MTSVCSGYVYQESTKLTYKVHRDFSFETNGLTVEVLSYGFAAKILKYIIILIQFSSQFKIKKQIKITLWLIGLWLSSGSLKNVKVDRSWFWILIHTWCPWKERVVTQCTEMSANLLSQLKFSNLSWSFPGVRMGNGEIKQKQFIRAGQRYQYQWQHGSKEVSALLW